MVAFLSSSHFTVQGLRRDAIVHLFFWLKTKQPLGKHLWFGEIMSVLNLIPGSGMDKLCHTELVFLVLMMRSRE